MSTRVIKPIDAHQSGGGEGAGYESALCLLSHFYMELEIEGLQSQLP